MMTCFSCKHLLSETDTQPNRIARVALNPHDDDLHSWGQETADLLTYLEAVLETVREANFSEDATLTILLDLSGGLTQEAQRRLQKFQQAADIWQKRAEAKTPPTAQHATT